MVYTKRAKALLVVHERAYFGDHMEKTKALVITALMALVVGSAVFLSLQAVSAEDVPTPPTEGQGVWYRLKWRGVIGKRFLWNGVPVTLDGTVSVVTRVLLVVDVDGKPVNVLVPRVWVFNGETLPITDLFDGAPFSLGDDAVLKTLRVELVKDTHTVTSYVAYAIQIGDASATALQPFNIDVVE